MGCADADDDVGVDAEDDEDADVCDDVEPDGIANDDNNVDYNFYITCGV